MFAYLVRRLAISALTLGLITLIIFALIRNMPGTPLTFNMEQSDPSRKMSQEQIDLLNKAYGLDKPWPQAYLVWVRNLFRGDLGSSFSHKKPVARVIGERIGPTLLLSVTSLSLTFLLAVPLGLYTTARSGKLDERTLSTGLYILYSFPVVVAALFLQYWFAVKLSWMPLFGMRSSGGFEQLDTLGRFRDVLWHAVLPIVVETYGSLAYYARFVQSNMQEVIRQDYIRTAQAKGVGPVGVLIKHAFRNTLIPFVTLVGLSLSGLFSGAIIIERIFAWPGMGQLFFESITTRDYPVIMGLTLMFSIMTLAGQLFADVLYAIVDPRIRLS